jgi:hypothetical protein
MSNVIAPLIRDLVQWVAREPRPYAEVMDAWRTSCPRLTVWEDAVDLGLVEKQLVAGSGLMVSVTDRGRALIDAVVIDPSALQRVSEAAN